MKALIQRLEHPGKRPAVKKSGLRTIDPDAQVITDPDRFWEDLREVTLDGPVDVAADEAQLLIHTAVQWLENHGRVDSRYRIYVLAETRDVVCANKVKVLLVTAPETIKEEEEEEEEDEFGYEEN